MKMIFADAETYYDPVYSLKSMTPIEYILDERYETICWAVAEGNNDPVLMPRDEVADYLRNITEPYAVASHNAVFDAAILAYRYSIHPDIIVDTYSMARALLGYKLKSISLAAMSDYFGLQKKGTAIKEVSGYHYDDLVANPDLWQRFQLYNIQDCINCREVYYRLRPLMTGRELRIIDTIIRMVTQPCLQLNKQKLIDYYNQVVADKDALLAKCNVNKQTLMSNPQFAELLISYGVTPPKIISSRTGKETWSFAKNDNEFMALCNHPNARVRDLMEARLGLRSTIEETRSARLIKIADATTSKWGIPFLPVPLKYSGAHTHRLSGDYDINLQNLNARKQKKLREAIEAPVGWIIVEVDAKQIEARLVAWLAKQEDLVEAFRNGKDIYSEFAGEIYKTDKVTKEMRFVGKTLVLGLGYGMGPEKLLRTLYNGARDLGFNVDFTIGQCQEWVNYYRGRFPKIPELWKHASHTIKCMKTGYKNGFNKIGPCYVDGTAIVLPSKLRMQYNKLEMDDERQWWYEHAGRVIPQAKLYGGKLIENICQALDRQYVMDAAMKTEERCNISIALQLHDANIYCIPKEGSDAIIQIIYEEMCHKPWWGKDFPAAAEVKVGTNYADLKEIKISEKTN